MKLHIDFDSNHCRTKYHVLVCIKRGNKGRISYNSGLLYFRYKKSVEVFMERMAAADPTVEIIKVNVYEATKPKEDEVKRKGYYCPYCGSWEYWLMDANANRSCPVCYVSSNDYYVKAYNSMWASGMQSKSTKKRQDNIRERKKRKESKG